jgi:hypothetical protein
MQDDYEDVQLKSKRDKRKRKRQALEQKQIQIQQDRVAMHCEKNVVGYAGERSTLTVVVSENEEGSSDEEAFKDSSDEEGMMVNT